MSLLESLTDPNSQSSLKPMPVPAAEARCIAGIPQNAPPCLLRSRQSRFGRGHLLGDCNHVGGDFGRGRDVCGGDGGGGDLGGGGDNIGRDSYGARNDFGRNFGRGFDHVSGNLRFG